MASWLPAQPRGMARRPAQAEADRGHLHRAPITRLAASAACRFSRRCRVRKGICDRVPRERRFEGCKEGAAASLREKHPQIDVYHARTIFMQAFASRVERLWSTPHVTRAPRSAAPHALRAHRPDSQHDSPSHPCTHPNRHATLSCGHWRDDKTSRGLHTAEPGSSAHAMTEAPGTRPTKVTKDITTATTANAEADEALARRVSPTPFAIAFTAVPGRLSTPLNA